MNKNESITFTVVTVVYNGVHLIEETILSVIAQKPVNFEYIIIDGGSNDGTLAVLEKYKTYIDKLISERDNGIYDAMNKGVAFASGNWINFLNAGDVFEPGILKKIEPFTTNIYTDIIYGEVSIQKDNQVILQIPFDQNSINYTMPFCHQSAFTRTCHLRTFPFSLRYKICSDYDFFLKCRLRGFVFINIKLPVSRFLYGGVSTGISRRFVKEQMQIIWRNHNRMYNRLFYLYKFMKSLIPINRSTLKTYFSHLMEKK